MLVFKPAIDRNGTGQRFSRLIFIGLHDLKICSKNAGKQLHELRILQDFPGSAVQIFQFVEKLIMGEIECYLAGRPLRSNTSGHEQMFRSVAMPAEKFAAEFETNNRSHAVPIKNIRNSVFVIYAISKFFYQRDEARECGLLYVPATSGQVHQADIQLLRNPTLPTAVHIRASARIGKTKHPEHRFFDSGKMLKPGGSRIKHGGARGHASLALLLDIEPNRHL